MTRGYEISRHDVGNGDAVLVLRPVGDKGFLAKMRDNPKSQDRYRLIVRAVTRVQSDGLARFNKRLVRMLDSGLSLFEIKVAGKVIRVMAYIHGNPGEHIIVLLFDFDGHKGSDKIPKSEMKKGLRLAAIAGETFREETIYGIR